MTLRVGQRVKAVKQITSGRITPGNPNGMHTLANEGDMGTVMGVESEDGIIDIRFDGKCSDVAVRENEVVWVPQKKKKRNPKWRKKLDDITGEIDEHKKKLFELEIALECARINYTTDGLLERVCEFIRDDCDRRADNVFDAGKLISMGLGFVYKVEPSETEDADSSEDSTRKE